MENFNEDFTSTWLVSIVTGSQRTMTTHTPQQGKNEVQSVEILAIHSDSSVNTVCGMKFPRQHVLLQICSSFKLPLTPCVSHLHNSLSLTHTLQRNSPGPSTPPLSLYKNSLQALSFLWRLKRGKRFHLSGFS